MISKRQALYLRLELKKAAKICRHVDVNRQTEQIIKLYNCKKYEYRNFEHAVNDCIATIRAGLWFEPIGYEVIH